MSVKLLTEHHLEFLSLKGGCRGLSESTLVKMPHCWKSHDTAQMLICWHNQQGQRSKFWSETSYISKLCVILQFVLDTFTSVWKLLSVLISGMSILIENWGYNSESWSDTLIKQFNNGINITWTRTNLNNRYSVAKLILFHPRFDLAAILGQHNAIIWLNQSVDCVLLATWN